MGSLSAQDIYSDNLSEDQFGLFLIVFLLSLENTKRLCPPAFEAVLKQKFKWLVVFSIEGVPFVLLLPRLLLMFFIIVENCLLNNQFGVSFILLADDIENRHL